MVIQSDIEDNDEDLNVDEEQLSSDSDYMDDEEVDEEEDDDDAEMADQESNNEENNSNRIYVPNMSRLSDNDDTQHLECDYSAYIMFHKAETGFPCLSFDVLEDSLGSGDQRAQNFPLTTYLVAGTEAHRDHLNKLLVMKFFNMNPIENKDDESQEDEDEDLPDLNCTSFPHVGCINRVRAKKIGDKFIAANWSSKGIVHLWDITEALQSCEDAGSVAEFNKRNSQTQPIQSFNGHQTQGYGLDWSPVDEGTLASGDCRKNIFIWKLSNDGWIVDQIPLTGHQASVEDIQWSPNEATILSSCSVDRSIRIWDTRIKHQSTMIIPDSHQSDVNVISWNRIEKAFILSGGDDGAIKVWDLRQIRRKTNGVPKPVATFKQHQGPITSVDWHRTDGTVFAASSEDNQVTQWDLALEKDQDQQEADESKNKQEGDSNKLDPNDQSVLQQLPPQLLFIHQGQKEIKEIRWHPQIPGVLISTACTGFDIFRTVSV